MARTKSLTRKVVSSSARAGLTFPTGRIKRKLVQGGYTPQCSMKAAVYLAALVEFVVGEVLENAAACAKKSKIVRITPRQLMLGMTLDPDLSAFLSGVTIVGAGVPPTSKSAAVVADVADDE